MKTERNLLSQLRQIFSQGADVDANEIMIVSSYYATDTRAFYVYTFEKQYGPDQARQLYTRGAVIQTTAGGDPRSVNDIIISCEQVGG